MGLFDGLKYGKAASELGLTVEQYKEFLQYQQSDRLTINAYKTYLRDYAGKMSVRRYIDQVINAPVEEQRIPAYLREDTFMAEKEPEPKFTIEDGTLVGLEIPEGCKKVVIPEGVTVIGRNLLQDEDYDSYAARVEILELPSTLKKISSYGLTGFTKLKNLVLPEGLEVIESWGLSVSDDIKQWVLPSTVKFIGSFAFGEEAYVESVSILSPKAKICRNVMYTFANDVQLNIPRQLSYIEEYLKDMLMDGTEYYTTTVNYIDVPESVEDVRFDEVEFEISDGVLSSAYIPCGCKRVVIPEEVKTIDYSALIGCSAEHIILPASLRIINFNAFRDCKRLKEIVLPERVELIENCAFMGCEKLESVQLPAGLKELSSSIFKGCTNLTSITLPETLQIIAMSAFAGCTGLTSITLPEKLKKIEYHAFQGCTNLRSVRMLCVDAKVNNGIFGDVTDVTITMPYAAREMGETLCDPKRNVRIQYMDEAEPAVETPRRRRRQPMPECETDAEVQENSEQPVVQAMINETTAEQPVTNRRRRRQPMTLDAVGEVMPTDGEKSAAAVKNAEQNASGVLYAVGQEPANIRARLDRLFEKLDSAYPDKVIVALTKNHGHWAETVTELYRLLGYPDSWSFLEAYGYQVKVNEENGKGGRPVKDRTAVIDELKKRYPQPVEGSIAFLMEQNPDLAPRIKTLQNSAQTVFGMRLADYLVQEGILAEKKAKQKIDRPAEKQLTPEEKLEQIIAELKRRYPTLNSAPKSLAELKEKNADLPMGTLNTLTQKIAQKTASEYCFEQGLICDAEKMKKQALELAADGRKGWGEQFTRIILDRGVNMFIEDEVKSLAQTANGYAAKVKGTSMYSVSIGVKDDEVCGMTCTCPYAAEGLNCKHMAAVLFATNAKLYVPKKKNPQAVSARSVYTMSKHCADNEILIVSRDIWVLKDAAKSSIYFSNVNIHPCSENPEYYLCEIRIDKNEVNLSYLFEMICPKLDGCGIALGRQVDDEHEVSDIGFYDGECLWIGSEFDLMYSDSDAPDEPEEWAYECNTKKRRTWAQSKKVWKRIWNKIPYYKVSDLIECYNENCISALAEDQEKQKTPVKANGQRKHGELANINNSDKGIEGVVYSQERLGRKTVNYRNIDQVSEGLIKDAIVFVKNTPKGFAKPDVKELTLSQDGMEFKVLFKIDTKLPQIWKGYYQQKETGEFFDPEEALAFAQQSGGYIDDGSGNYISMPLENSIPEDTPVLSPQQVEKRVCVFVTIANLCAKPDIASQILAQMPRKKNKTLYKGRTKNVAYLNVVDQRGWTYQLVAKNESDIQLSIELRSKVPVVDELVNHPDDLLASTGIFF